MRSMLLWGCVAAAAAGCETTRPALVNCAPCKTHKTSCPATPATPAPSAAPGKPAVLPPSIKEVRMEEAEPKQFASVPSASPAPAFMPAPVATPAPVLNPTPAPVAVQTPVQQPAANPGDVLLIPRWVYVPYSPHHPSGTSRMPAHANQLPTSMPYVQAGDQMTVLPPMGAAPAANAQHAMLMEQCLQQMKQLNQRMNEMEAKTAAKPAIVPPASMPVPAPVSPASAPLPNPPQMLPLPPPLAAPMIPPAK